MIDLVTHPFREKTLSKVSEFMALRDRLKYSHTFAVARVESRFAALQSCASRKEVLALSFEG